MAESCPPLEVLADLTALPPDDPRRRHLEQCPRCRVRLLDFQDFLDGAEPVPAPQLAHALERLDAAVHTATAGPALAVVPEPSARPRGRTRGLLHRLERPAWRGALALAALLLLLVALGPLLRGALERPRELRLRGQEKPAALQVHPAAWTSAGDLVLRWAPVPGADAYAVHLLDNRLTPLAQRPAGVDSSLTLSAAALRALLPADATHLVWQVEALTGGDPLATSPPAAVALPLPGSPRRPRE